MRWFGNVVHLLTGGLLLASAWLLAAVLLYPFAETRRLAGPCLQCALFHLSPRGREFVREADVAAYQGYVRTGRFPTPAPAQRKLDRRRLSTRILWTPFGLALATGHLVHCLLFAILKLSPPSRSPSFSVLSACLFPEEWRSVPACDGRARLLTPKQQRWPTLLKRHPNAGLGGPGLKLRSLGAALAIWASVSTSGSLLVTSSEPLGDEGLQAGAVLYPRGSAEAATGPIGRPQAMPPLPVGGGSLAVETADPCETPRMRQASSRLSRRHLSFALPLGSRPLSPSAGSIAITPLARIEKLTMLSASVKNARARRQPCAKAVADHAARSAAYAADRAVFVRLSAKAAADEFGRKFPLVQGAGRLAPAHEYLWKVQRFLASTSPAKAPNTGDVEDMAKRIARASSIL